MSFKFLCSKLFVPLFALALLLAGCSSSGDDESSGDESSEGQQVEASADEDSSGGESENDSESAEDDSSSEQTSDETVSTDPPAIEPGTVVRIVAHDSFSTSDGLFDEFTLETGIEVDVLKGGDAGEIVARAILSSDQPEGDILFGIDNTFLQRGLDADLFLPYQSPGLATVPDELQLDDQYRVTPIDFGDVCVNYWLDGLDNPPTSLDDLTDPSFAGNFVTSDPETSSPGFAFLLATIARYGEDGWEQYWQQLADGGVTVTPGWTEAYYGEFIAGGGDKQIVTSYASSPVAAVLFSTEPIDTPPTGVMSDGCFRQIEFAGILDGTDVEAAAQQVMDFMLSETFQADIPLNMFVSPANADVPLPELYQAHAAVAENPLTLSPSEIEANRSDWTARWAEIVLR